MALNETRNRMPLSLDDAGHDAIFLQLVINKALQRDGDGNVIFTVEASNENLDIEGQRVLQSALLGTKDYFLKSGVISKDHKHRVMNPDGTFDLREEYVIGEPLDVFTDGPSTVVRGKLYGNNKYAQGFIDLLEQGSSRVRASVGGLVPRVKKAVENGKKVGTIVSVLWDDLALTIAPVNHTVGPAWSMAKSLSSVEFVKALSAGYGTDASSFTGGRALQKEDVGNGEIIPLPRGKVIVSLIGAIARGELTGLDSVESFLAEYGIPSAEAWDIVREIITNRHTIMEAIPMAKGSFWDKIKADLQKSMNAKKPAEDDEDAGDLTDEETQESDEEDEDENYEDAAPIVKALQAKMETLHGTLETMAKAQTAILGQLKQSEQIQKSLTEGMIAVMDRTEKALASPNPRKGAVTGLEAAMAKAMGGAAAERGGEGASGRGLKPFTPSTLDRAKDILTKAVKDGELDLFTSAKYETQMNKSIGKLSYAFTPDFVEFMWKKLSA